MQKHCEHMHNFSKSETGLSSPNGRLVTKCDHKWNIKLMLLESIRLQLPNVHYKIRLVKKN